MTPARVPPMASAYVGVRATDEVTRTLGGDHDHVDAFRRLDAAEADVEAVRERERLAGRHVRCDVRLVHLLLLGVGQEDHDDVGLRGGLRHRDDAQTRSLGLGLRRRAVAQADAHVDA
jgi:hypothetical protein